MNEYELNQLKENIKTRRQRIKETHARLNQSALNLQKIMPEPSVQQILDKHPELLQCLNELIDLVRQATDME